MKNFWLILLCTLFFVGAVSAQTDSTATKEIGWAGGGWDNGPVGAFGLGAKVLGNCWIFTGTELGKDQDGVLEFAYLSNLNTLTSKVGLDNTVLNRITVGIVPGFDFTWENTQENDGKPTIARIVGSVGGIANVKLSEKIGVWAYYKHRTKLEAESSFLNSNIFAGGISFNASVLSSIF